MSCKFKVGDKVKRIGSSRVLDVGGTYEVAEVCAEGWLVIKGYPHSGEFDPSLFAFAEEVPSRRPHYDLIVAWANGAEIEIKGGASGKWKSCPTPSFIPAYEYRIKPQPNPEVEKLNKLIEDMDKQLSDAKKRLKEITNV